MKTYIIHVSTDVQRERHIRQEMTKTSFSYTMVNDGDIKDLTADILARYFTGGAGQMSDAAMSCAYKHLLCYRDMISNKIDYALILEDDMFFYKDFEKTIAEIVAESKERNLSNVFISLEESRLKYVKGSELEKGRQLYPKQETRFTGAYILDLACARTLAREIERHKCDEAIDLLHTRYSKAGLINVYWLHPPIAIQGSLNGKMLSMIDSKRKKRALAWQRFKFFMERNYKRLLYRLR